MALTLRSLKFVVVSYLQFDRDASKYSVETLKQWKVQQNERFFQLTFENVRAPELKKIFPISKGKGKRNPNKDMRLSAASVMAWREMTQEQQDNHVTRTKANKERAKRAREREEEKTSEPPEEQEEEAPPPMDATMISTADSQTLRDLFIQELQGKDNEASAPKHLSGKPPATIGQQNDGLVMRMKKSLFRSWAKFKASSTPSKRLATAPYPEQYSMLVIINEVADPNVNGGPVPLKHVRRRKKQMFVAAESKRDAVKIVRELISGFPKEGIAHNNYEHIRMYGTDDVNHVCDNVLSREREKFQVPTMTNAVDNFVGRPRSNTF